MACLRSCFFFVKIGCTIATHNVLGHAICVVGLRICSPRVRNCMGFGAIA